jgi:tetratricopeptide (TPR) repeat protein
VIDLYRAHVLYREGRDEEARKLSITALQIFQKFKLMSKAITCRLLLARLHLRGGDTFSARQECDRALKTLNRLELPVLCCQAYALRGEIQQKSGHRRRAYDAYLQAQNHLERLRGNIQGEELKISFMKDRVEIYEALVGLCVERANDPETVDEVFEYVQLAKSRTLMDLMSTSHSASWLAPEGKTELANEIRNLRQELNWYFRATSPFAASRKEAPEAFAGT